MLALLTDLGWKSALIAGIALLAAFALRKRPASEAVTLLRVAVAALLLLPVAAFVLPTLELAILPAEPAPDAAAMAAAAIDAPTTSAEPTPRLLDLILPLYALGAALILSRLAIGLATLHRWTRAARPSADPRWQSAAARAAGSLRRPVRLRVSPHVAAPLSWGIAPAWLLIGPSTERRAEQADAIVAHEMAHVRRFDWPVLVAAQVAGALFWFNPLVWLVRRALARQIELAADEEAVRHIAHADYAQALLAAAQSAGHPAACGMTVTRTMLAQRIGRVLDIAPSRPANRTVCALLVLTGAGVALSLSATRLVAPAAPPRAEATSLLASANPLPAIIPAAQARPVTPAIAPRRKPVLAATRTRPASPPLPAAAPEPATPPELAIRIEPRHLQAQTLGHKPGTPPQPPMKHAGLVPPARTFQAKIVPQQPAGTLKTTARDTRNHARDMALAANKLRMKAREFSALYAKSDNPPYLAEAYRTTAAELRRQAEQLETDTQRLMASL